jgi:hypothetical protein
MASGPDDERRQPSDPTFADVMNAFSLNAGRFSRRRRGGRRGDASEFIPVPEQAEFVRAPEPKPVDMRDLEADHFGSGIGAAAVRPYTWTRGRTRSGLELAIETLVSTSQQGRNQMGLLQVEHHAVAQLCEQTRSVAEVAALMSLPLGVARVLLGDMAELGVVTVHRTASSAGNAPDLALMERVLSGLRRL